ncbi:MAG: ABC transporter permease [Bacteroidetes bacterium]|nr:ABC transporter permease [Bacteroidota bacterium]
MLRSYLLAPIRNLLKGRLTTGISIASLTVSFVTSLFIFGWVLNEWSYDRHLPNANLIYRVATHYDAESSKGIASTYARVKDLVLNQFSEINSTTRIFNAGFLGAQQSLIVGNNVFTSETIYYADPNFFDVFAFRIVKGDQRAPLNGPDAIVLTKSAAHRYFGDQEAVGNTIRLGGSRNFVVTAVMQDIPTNTHFRFDVLVTMNAHPWEAQTRMWSGVVYHTYIKVNPGTNVADLDRRIDNFMDHFPDDPKGYGRDLDLTLIPVTDIHLNSHDDLELQVNGNKSYVYLFLAVGTLVLLIAAFNYINLTLAQYTQRFREMGIRKVLGAKRAQLIVQLSAESTLLFILSMLMATMLFVVGEPFYASLTGQHLMKLEILMPLLLLIALVNVILGLLSGVLPGWTLSKVKPVILIRPGATGKQKKLTRRACFLWPSLLSRLRSPSPPWSPIGSSSTCKRYSWAMTANRLWFCTSALIKSFPTTKAFEPNYFNRPVLRMLQPLLSFQPTSSPRRTLICPTTRIVK